MCVLICRGVIYVEHTAISTYFATLMCDDWRRLRRTVFGASTTVASSAASVSTIVDCSIGGIGTAAAIGANVLSAAMLCIRSRIFSRIFSCIFCSTSWTQSRTIGL